jgi:hypothetical protein
MGKMISDSDSDSDGLVREMATKANDTDRALSKKTPIKTQRKTKSSLRVMGRGGKYQAQMD